MKARIPTSAYDEAGRLRPGPLSCRRPVRICFPFAGGGIGGSHISALKLIEALSPAEFEPVILVHSGEGQLGEMLHEAGLAYENAPLPAYFSRTVGRRRAREFVDTIRGFRTLARFLRDREIDIVHTNDGAMHATWAIPARLAGAKLLWHHRSSPDARGLRLMAPFLASHVVSVSQYAAPRPGFLSAARFCSVVHSPFDLEISKVDRASCRRDAIADLYVAPDTRILGFFGNLVDRKRPLLFVDAVATFRRLYPETPVIGLLFGGALQPGLDRAVIARANALGIAGNIRLMGFRYPPEPWIAACDALVVTAVEEPFGRTLIEAMLLRTPVIAANSGGNPEAIHHAETGYLARADDPQSFARNIAAVLHDPLSAACVTTAACRDAHARFGIERHRDSITDIYRQMLAAA